MNKIALPTKYLFLLLCAVTLVTACKKSDTKPDPGPGPEKKPTVTEVNTSVNTALAGKDTLSQFAAMYKSAGLTQAEVDAGVTVFAPSNKAYTLKTDGMKKLTAATDVYLPDSSVVRDYIVPQKIDINKITSGASFNALSGKKLIITKVGDKWLLNGVYLNVTVLSTGDNAIVFSVAGLLNASILPHITGVSDVKTFPGWPLTIYGGNFDVTLSKDVVKIDNIVATVHSGNADSLVITVPQGVKDGVLTVKTKGRTVGMSQNLTIQQAHVSTLPNTHGGPIQGVTVDASDNILWTDNFYVGNEVRGRLGKFSSGESGYYAPYIPNPNGDGQTVAIFNEQTTLWAITTNSQKQVYFATEAQKAPGFSGIFALGTGSNITAATWWAGQGTNYNATNKTDLKVYTTAITFDKQDNFYMFNGGAVQKITSNGAVSTAISGQQFLSADGTVKQLTSSYGLIVSGSKTYISDNANARIWLKDGNDLKVIAGNNTHVAKDGVGGAAQFGSPFGIALDKKGNLYVCDNDYATSKFIIRMINPFGEVTTIAGGAGNGTEIDGIGTAAGFNGVNCIAVDSKGMLYIGTDDGNVRKITFQ